MYLAGSWIVRKPEMGSSNSSDQVSAAPTGLLADRPQDAPSREKIGHGYGRLPKDSGSNDLSGLCDGHMKVSC
jgi:hypothetical protein